MTTQYDAPQSSPSKVRNSIASPPSSSSSSWQAFDAGSVRSSLREYTYELPKPSLPFANANPPSLSIFTEEDTSRLRKKTLQRRRWKRQADAGIDRLDYGLIQKHCKYRPTKHCRPVRMTLNHSTQPCQLHCRSLKLVKY